MIGLLIGLIVSTVFAFIDMLSGQGTVFRMEFWKEIGYTLIYAVVLTFINSGFFEYMERLKLWKKYSRFRILTGAVGSILLTMLGIFWIRIFIAMGIEGQSWERFLAGERTIYYVIALLITILISTVFHAIHFYKNWQESKVKEQKIIAGTASAKFDALKNQLDPHFLFNSLNVLTSLIEEDPYQAQKFTTSLSKVYRYVLEQKNKDLVTVDEELQFARSYVRLLKMRFEDSIVCDIPEAATHPDAKIVPLSLQLLLENAVKHNTVSATKPLHIEVFEEENMLVVRNNLQEKQVMGAGSGVGLKNIQQRYNFLSERQVSVVKTPTTFEIRIPILSRQLNPAERQQSYIEDKRYQKARKKVDAIKNFFGNLITYCVVIPFLVWLNYRTTSFPWAIFPMLGWGFGLFVQGMEAYGYNPLWGKRWEERKIREYMERDDF